MATIKIPIKPSAAMPLTTNFPAFVKNNGTNFPVTGLAYDDATEETAYWQLRAENYGSGNLTLDMEWYSRSASSGDVVLGAAIACITPNSDTQDIETKPFATAQTVTDSHLGTTTKRLHSISLTITNLDSIAPGDYLMLKIYRAAAAGGDTITGDVILGECVLSYSDT